MIDFIYLTDDNYKEIIDKIMINYDYDYSYIKYKDHSNSDNFKIYLIEIKDNGENIDILDKIRIENDDWQSMIIVLSRSSKFKCEIYDKKYLIIDYICVYDNLLLRLKNAITIALKNYDTRPKTLKYCYKKVYYSIPYNKIIYIEKEKENNRCIIKTETKEYYIPYNITQIEKILDKRFIKCNRYHIINIEQVYRYNNKENIIYFRNNLTVTNISREKRKELQDILRCIKL